MNNLSGSLSFHGDVSGQMGANLIPRVEANPSGTPTGILTSIRVGDIIYSIPSGGGGEGGTDNYNDLLNKPQINGVVLTGNKTSDDLDLSNKAHVNELSGASVDFQNGQELPLLKCIVDIELVQSGSGTPSPDNIRPISGHSSVTVTVASASGGSGNDTTVSLGRTVYGGTLDVTTGVLKVTHGYIYTDGSFNVSNVAYGSGVYYTIVKNSIGAKTNNPLPISDKFKSESVARVGNCYITYNGNYLIAVLPDQTADTIAKATQWFSDNPTQFVYELATPQTVQLTPEKVRTIMGINNISANTGNINIIYINNVNDPAIEFILNNL